MNSALSPVSLTSFYSPEDGTVRKADLYFYAAGTLDPITVYEDSGLSVPHSIPIPTGGSGRVPPIFVDEIPAYRIRALDHETGVLLEDIDGIPGAEPDPAEVPPPTPIDTDALLKTGDVIAAWSAAASRTGFVRLNGGSIGSATSGATERANADAQALFLHLWQQDTANRLTVLPSKGATAAGDWAANKTIALPDLRGRALFGMDTMGGSATTRLSPTGHGMTAGTGNTLGDNGGSAVHVLTQPQLAAHNHPITDPGHNHTITDPGHNHTHSDPGHTHADAGHSHGFVGGKVLGEASSGMTTGSSFDDRIVVTGASGVSIAGGFAAITNNTTGITNVANTTGITVQNKVTSITVDNMTGGGAAHNNLPPLITMAWYMKL